MSTFGVNTVDVDQDIRGRDNSEAEREEGKEMLAEHVSQQFSKDEEAPVIDEWADSEQRLSVWLLYSS